MAKERTAAKDQIDIFELPKKEKFLGVKAPWLVRYIFALVSVGLGFLIRLAITNITGPGLPTYITFYPAVMFAALIAGIGPGMVATVATALIVDYWVIPTHTLFIYNNPVDFVGQVLFILMGVFMSYVAGFYRKTQYSLKDMVAKRTASLDKSNEQLKLEIEGRKKYENALRESEEKFKLIATNTPDHILVQDADLRYNFVLNPQLGLTEKDMIGKTDYDILSQKDAINITKIKKKVLETGKSESMSMPIISAKGEVQYFEGIYIPRRDRENQIDGIIGYFKNVTGQKRAEEEKARLLAEIESRAAELDATISSMAVGMIIYDPAGKAIRMNDVALKLLPREVFFNKTIDERARIVRWETEEGKPFPPDEIPVKRALVGETVHNVILAMPLPDHKLWISASAAPIHTSNGQMIGVVASFVDITKQKYAEEDLKKLNRTLKALSESSQAIAASFDEIEYLNYVCKIIVNDCGYSMVWIGFAENDTNKTVRPVAQAGFEEGYLKKLNITWDDSERGRGPTGKAIRTGKLSICSNMLSDPNFEPWRKEALKRGYASSVVLPLMANNKAIGALNIYSNEINPFSKDEINLLSELAHDISVGITSIRLRIENERSEEALRETKDYLENLFNHANAPIIVWRPDLKVTRFNHAFEILTGLKASDIVGKKLEILFPKESREDSLKKIQRALEGEYWESIEIPILQKNGDEKIVLWNSANIYEIDGKTVFSTIAQGQDITRRKKAEEESQELLKEKETLLKEIHHRVKNNMQMISSLIRLQSRRINNKYVKEVLEDGQNRIRSMALVHEILYKSDNLSNLDVNEYLKRIINDLLNSYKRPDRNIQIDLKVDKIFLGLDSAIPCGLIVNELVSNSLKYAFNKRKKGKIMVLLKDNKSSANLIIKDNGIGLPTDFDIKNMQTLGLQLVETLTKQIDGKLEIHAKKGTEFKINFPINKNG